jgi:hypothetical protein
MVGEGPAAISGSGVTLKLRVRRRWTWFGGRDIGQDRLPDEEDGELQVVGCGYPDLYPVRSPGPETDVGIGSELFTLGANDGFRQPDVQGAVGVEMSHLPPADPDSIARGNAPWPMATPGIARMRSNSSSFID